MSHTIDENNIPDKDKWHWIVGDKVYHVHDSNRTGIVTQVVKEDGADMICVQFDRAGVWYKGYWLRRAP